MTDDPVEQALAELQDLVRCRCHPAYTGRGLHDPDCECDNAEAVKIVTDHIEAQAAEIESLRGDVAKAMLIIEAYSDDEGYIPKRVVHLWNALHCSNQEGICHCGTLWNAAPQNRQEAIHE